MPTFLVTWRARLLQLPHARLRLGLLGVALLACLTLLRCDDSVDATGSIIPTRQTVVLHAPHDGVVLQTWVGVGEHIVKDAPLLALDINLAPEDLLEHEQRLANRRQEKQRLQQALNLLTQLLSTPETIRTYSLDALEVSGETFNQINDFYAARLELDNATEHKRLNVSHQKTQLSGEASLIQRNIELLKRHLESSKKAAEARDNALQAKRHDFATLMQLADKGLVPGTDVTRERDLLLQAEVAASDNRKQADQIELDISNGTLRISELKMQSESLEEDANNRLHAAKLRYDLRLARLSEHKVGLQRALQDAELGTTNVPGTPASAQTLRSPATGLVTHLGFAMVGDSVQAGKRLVAIQPDDNLPQVLLQVSPLDVLRLHAGQTAHLSFDAYPAWRYGKLTAQLQHVFAQPDGSGFAAVLRLSRTSLNVHGVEVALLPNLQVHASIVVRHCSWLTRILQP